MHGAYSAQMKNTTIDPEALYWASCEGGEFRMPGQCVLDCSHGGPCDNDVAYWAPKIRAQMAADAFPNAPTPASIRANLKGYGAWDNQELADDERNFERLVWLAATDIAECESPDCSEPVATN
jgi:hypothetical protein